MGNTNLENGQRPSMGKKVGEALFGNAAIARAGVIWGGVLATSGVYDYFSTADASAPIKSALVGGITILAGNILRTSMDDLDELIAPVDGGQNSGENK